MPYFWVFRKQNFFKHESAGKNLTTSDIEALLNISPHERGFRSFLEREMDKLYRSVTKGGIFFPQEEWIYEINQYIVRKDISSYFKKEKRRGRNPQISSTLEEWMFATKPKRVTFSADKEENKNPLLSDIDEPDHRTSDEDEEDDEDEDNVAPWIKFSKML